VNPYLFIVGCPRSGTTLLRRIVDAHPRIAISHETHWVMKVWERRIGVTEDGHVTPELLRDLRGDRRFVRMEPDMDALERLVGGDEPVSFARFVTDVFDDYGRFRGKPLVGDKTPGYVRELRALAGLWPHVKIVHLVRDGRDVCLSATNWTRRLPGLEKRFPTWREEPVATAALWWEWHVRSGREDGLALGPERYHEVRYEDLVADPEATCAALCEFLEVPYDDAMVRFHEGRTKPQSDRDAKHAWLPVTAGLRDWRTELPEADVARFEAAAGDLLEELGYERALDRVPDAASEQAMAIRPAFAAATARVS
jgi:hypothetical protein